jgi:hypothetical protein
MKRFARIASYVAVAAVGGPLAVAQAPPAGVAPQPRGGAPQTRPAPARNAGQPAQRPLRRSIVHHYPYPYPEYYHGDDRAGFRNPGGVGRYLEYYPPGNRFQEEGDPVRVAGFDRAPGVPNRAEQMAAEQIGIQRENAIMSHIDSYARPAFGVGYFGGFY